MDITTSTTADNLVYLHGTFHQGDEVHFMDYSRGCQCVMNSIVAIALSKICLVRQWTTEHLDSILKAGDTLCRGITRIHRLPSRPSHPYGRQPHSLIFMSTLYKATCCLPASSLLVTTSLRVCAICIVLE